VAVDIAEALEMADREAPRQVAAAS
jgi:hypothetical protein